MAEQVNLTTPVAGPTISNYHLERLTLDIDQASVLVQLKGNNGEALSKTYSSTTTPTGASLLSSINTSNNSVTSLVARVYNRLITDGVLVGTVAGTPQ